MRAHTLVKDWHFWFAWYPICIGPEQRIYWMRHVGRQTWRFTGHLIGDGHLYHEYREPRP